MIPGVFAGVPCGDERGGGERGDGRHDGAERVQRRPGGLLLMNKPYTLHPTPQTLNHIPSEFNDALVARCINTWHAHTYIHAHHTNIHTGAEAGERGGGAEAGAAGHAGACMYLDVCVCERECVVCMYACMRACMFVCMHGVCACFHIYIYIFTRTRTQNTCENAHIF